MPELTINPDAAETFAEETDDEEFAEWLRQKAEDGERITTEIDENVRDRIACRAVIWQIREDLDDEDLSEYERGKLEGKLEAFEYFLDNTEYVEWREKE